MIIRTLIASRNQFRGLDVTAIVRGENKSVAPHSVNKDLFAITSEDLKDFDVVVDAFGAWTEDVLPLAQAQGKALAEFRERTDVKWTFISPAGDFQAEACPGIVYDEITDYKYAICGNYVVLYKIGEEYVQIYRGVCESVLGNYEDI